MSHPLQINMRDTVKAEKEPLQPMSRAGKVTQMDASL